MLSIWRGVRARTGCSFGERAVWNNEARCEGVVREKATDGQVMVDFGGGEEPRCGTRTTKCAWIMGME